MTRTAKLEFCRRLAIAVVAAAGLLGSCAPALAMDVRRPEIREFIHLVAKQDSFDERRLRKLLRAAELQPAIIEAMDRPAEKAKAWYEYRPIFVNDKRIQEGLEFWLAHRAQL